MARRRLLTILATSAVLITALAGPAAAIDLVDQPEDSIAEATEETVEATVEELQDVADPVAEEPVAGVTDTVEETVAPEPSPSSSPSPQEESTSPAASSGDDSSEALVAAGDVAAAPSLASLTGTGGSAPTTQSRRDLLPVTPQPAPPAREEVPTPQVAPAPAAIADAATPSELAQAVRRAVPEKSMPVLVLVAIASLLAAGVATVREARIVAA